MGNTMDILEAAQEWLRYAENDLGSAEFLLGRRPIPIEIICFHCQQSTEKALKGLLVLHEIRPPTIQNLQELFFLCKPFTADIDTIQTPCKNLNAYSVQPRYPNEMVTTEEEMKKALADAKAVMEFIRPLYPLRETSSGDI
ncbi:hypothetical protein AGMMS49546_24780 [Spirochaetia bacterium]|nr:hypothetical protein AGMMS49546_24780 [Spirochaetia bacterium]